MLGSSRERTLTKLRKRENKCYSITEAEIKTSSEGDLAILLTAAHLYSSHIHTDVFIYIYIYIYIHIRIDYIFPFTNPSYQLIIIYRGIYVCVYTEAAQLANHVGV